MKNNTIDQTKQNETDEFVESIDLKDHAETVKQTLHPSHVKAKKNQFQLGKVAEHLGI